MGKQKTFSKKSKRFNSKFSKLNSQNSKQGKKAEDRVEKILSKEYTVYNVSRHQSLSDMESGIPDLVIVFDNGRKRYVEVKTIKMIHRERDNYKRARVQFYKPKLKELANENGLIIVEVRKTTKTGKETGKKYYKVANAKDVYPLVAKEQGNNVKIEAYELNYFEDLDVDELP